MKKYTKIIIIIAAVLLILTLVLIAVLFFLGEEEPAEEDLIREQVIERLESSYPEEAEEIFSKAVPSIQDIQDSKPVEEVIQNPEPDQSWMDTPIPKSKFYKWVQDATGTKT